MNRQRGWLLVAGVLVGCGIAAGVAFVLAPDGTVDQRFRPDGTVTVALDPDEPAMVWSSSTADVRCEIRDSAGLTSTVALNAQLYRRYELQSGGRTLYGVVDFRANPAGTYDLACDGDVVAVGEAPWVYRMQDDLLTAGLPAGLLPAALAAGLVVWGLRRRHRRSGHPDPSARP